MKRLWIIWIFIFIVCCLSFFIQANKRNQFFLYQPQQIEKIAFIDFNQFFEKKGSDWFYNQKKNEEINAVVNLLESSCYARYKAEEIPMSLFERPLRLKVNENDEIWIGEHNEVQKAHYFKRGNATYLCNEQIRPRFERLLNNY